jgi:adenosylcobyric acid synthase
MEVEMAKALMVLGTGSHAGKSLLTAAFCRILARQGYRVAPFKAQNMALNSAATPEGFEIGRAQAMQADAAGIPPSVDMNPVLIKPSCDTSAQVIVRGRVWGQITAADYHQGQVEELYPTVAECYRRLSSAHDIVVLEGAGSPAEVNLKKHDIVNLRMAELADAACLLVGDIDRGGVFASLLGTLELLEADERARVRGFLINKFRGDRDLLQPGIDFIEKRIGKPCMGVVPYLMHVGLEEEDSVAVEDRSGLPPGWWEVNGSERRLKIGVIAYPYMSNFTDFDALAAEPSVALAYLAHPRDLEPADVVILPGSKQTSGDLAWLRREGWDLAVCGHASRGGITIGICGGMQMLGTALSDPEGMEGGGKAEGLGLLPVETALAPEKITVRAWARLVQPALFGQVMATRELEGYEIHLGLTEYHSGATPIFDLSREGHSGVERDGVTSSDGLTMGTYLHGLFDSDSFRHAFIRAASAASGLTPPSQFVFYSAERESRFDRLATSVRQAIDVDGVLRWLGL